MQRLCHTRVNKPQWYTSGLVSEIVNIQLKLSLIGETILETITQRWNRLLSSSKIYPGHRSKTHVTKKLHHGIQTMSMNLPAQRKAAQSPLSDLMLTPHQVVL